TVSRRSNRACSAGTSSATNSPPAGHFIITSPGSTARNRPSVSRRPRVSLKSSDWAAERASLRRNGLTRGVRSPLSIASPMAAEPAGAPLGAGRRGGAALLARRVEGRAGAGRRGGGDFFHLEVLGLNLEPPADAGQVRGEQRRADGGVGHGVSVAADGLGLTG